MAREVRETPGRPGERLDGADARLLRVIDAEFVEAARRAGRGLLCAPGCSDCCHGPFPITRLDMRRLRRGLEAMDPERASRLVERAARAVARLTPGFPGDAATGRLAADDTVLDRYFARHTSLACPVLDPGTDRCLLYDHRPVSCRSYGPPLRFGDRETEPCPLCFRDASREEIERCRVDSDPDGLERALLDRLGVEPGEDWETLIAFAVAGERNGR
jgi:Fe-S-cluster containining protein